MHCKSLCLCFKGHVAMVTITKIYSRSCLISNEIITVFATRFNTRLQCLYEHQTIGTFKVLSKLLERAVSL
jgi:hypothetical protein